MAKARKSAGGTRKASPKRAVRSRAARSAGAAPRPAAALPRRMCVVGIGASAGGFDAISELLRETPPDTGLAFVVIQHLSPTQKSLAAELFAKRTAMAVQEATDGVRVQPNTVYTLPADTHAGMAGGALRLHEPIDPRGRRLPIDEFFRSLASDQKERAIAVILSGTGTDGTLGTRHIVAEGGIVLVQEPSQAQFDGMPRSAITTGLVTHVLPLAAMPKAMVDWSRNPLAADLESLEQPEEMGKGGLRTILELLRTQHGYNFHDYKHRMLVRRIRRRMGLRRTERLTDYIALLRKDPPEVDALFRDLLIGVTEFFRDPDAWRALESDVIEGLVRDKPDGTPIRVWVSGAATGEEAYSVAMVLKDKVRELKKDCPIQVFATDTNEEAIASARSGLFSAGIAARVTPARLNRYFIEVRGDHHYQVTRELREAVIFGVHNLFSDPPFSRMDLITCRNLLIYLGPEAQQRVIRLFHFSLRRGGFLFLGPAETVGKQDDKFGVVSRKWRIYRRTGASSREEPDWQGGNGPHSVPTAGVRHTSNGTQVPAALAQQIILDRFAPAAVLINHRFEVLYFCGPTERFLVQPRGGPTKDLLVLARDGLRTQLRNAVRKAETGDEAVTVHDLRVRRGAAFEPARITIAPAAGDPENRPMLVVFEDEPRPPPARKPPGRTDADLVRQLEDELRAAKDDLQTTIERLETSNEELRVSHEEVVSANEELQSVNEEMESSKEELQSLNEELNTVNQQLQAKIGELENANNDLKNLLASSDIATLCLDRDLRIKWFTPSTREVLNVIQTDIGRPISDLGSALAGQSLVQDARAVLDKLTPVETEIRTERDRWYLRRTLPYRTEDDRIDGVIASYSDVTQTRREGERKLADQEALSGVLEQRVAERTRQLRALGSELALAEERERRAVARDLHDDLGQVLNLARLKLDRLTRAGSDPETSAAVAEVDSLLERANKSARTLVVQLSPPVLEELGLGPALQWLAEELQHTYGLQVDLDLGRDVEGKVLSQATRSILFRAARELLINVARHAHVARAHVAYDRNGGFVTLTVTDGGAGFDPGTLEQPGRALGLINLRERLSYIGGSAQIESAPGRGTEVRLRAPVDGGNHAGGKR